jgi:two-component system NarL family response regulator
MSLRIIIADDHPFFVEGLKVVLEEIEGLRVLDTAANGRQLLDRLRQSPADMILLDLNMPQMDGIEVLKILKNEFPQVKVIVLTNYDHPDLLKEVETWGAKGYLLKDTSSGVLKTAIERVASGKTWFAHKTPEIPDSHYIDDFMKKYQLTRREAEIIKMIATGLTSKEIGKQLFISEFTINAHRRNICRKLDIHTPVGLLNFAKEQGLV